MFKKIDQSKNNPLVESYYNGDIKKFRQLLEDGANVDCMCKVKSYKNDYDESEWDNFSLLGAIIINENKIPNNKEFFDELMSWDVFLGSMGEGDSLISLAIKYQNNSDYLASLIEKGAEINIVTKNHTGLAICDTFFASNSNKKIDLLLQQDIDLNLVDSSGRTALHNLLISYTYLKKPENILSRLIEKGADPMKTDRYGRTALNYWVNTRCEKSFKILIDNGVKIDNINSFSYTALIESGLWNKLSSTMILINAGADINFKDNNGDTVAMYFAKNCWNKESMNTIHLLQEAGVDFSIQNSKGDNLIHEIARHVTFDECGFEVFENNKKLLLVENNEKQTPLDIIKDRGYKNQYKKLLKLTDQNNISK